MNLSDLPVFADGSDGGIWELDASIEWPRILSGSVDSRQRYVKVSDVIELIRQLEMFREDEQARDYHHQR